MPRSNKKPPARGDVVQLDWVDIFEDPIQLNPNPLKFDLEPNNTPGQATAIAIGDTLVGTLTVNDLDYFRFAATQGQTYTFYTSTDDGVRLWVNGVLLINHWSDQSNTEWSGSIALVAGLSVQAAAVSARSAAGCASRSRTWRSSCW